MKRNVRVVFYSLLCLVAAGAAFVAMTGCEVAEGLAGLTISPSYATLTMDSNVVELAVSGDTNNIMALPIKWSVDEPWMGRIEHQSGFRALYRATAYGVSTVRARDQYSNEGCATITQTAGSYSLSLAVSHADATTWTVSVGSGGSGPYTWWVSDPTLGSISSSGNGPSAVYTAEATNMQNFVFVRDSRDREGSARIP